MSYKRSQGFTIIELMIALGIIAFIAALMLVRFNMYKARGACRSAAHILMADIKFQQQRAFTLESEQRITIAPGGNHSEYKVWSAERDIPVRIVNFRELFSAEVQFTPGQEDRDLIFYPWTADSANEWSIVKSNNVNSITLQGGDLSYTIKIDPGGKVQVVEN